MGAYQVAVTNRKRPTVLALSRQAMANQPGSAAAHVAKGGYILHEQVNEMLGDDVDVEYIERIYEKLGELKIDYFDSEEQAQSNAFSMYQRRQQKKDQRDATSKLNHQQSQEEQK